MVATSIPLHQREACTDHGEKKILICAASVFFLFEQLPVREGDHARVQDSPDADKSDQGVEI